MTDERIDIEITDKVSPRISEKLHAIAEAARSAESSLTSMKREMLNLDVSAFSKMAAASAKVAAAQARQTNATARLTAVQSRLNTTEIKRATQLTRLALLEQKLATEKQRTLLITQRANTEQSRGVAVEQRAAEAATRRTAAEARKNMVLDAGALIQRKVNRIRNEGNAASRQSIQQTQNLVYQLNDIVVSLASGQKPLTVFLQQGSQISTIYGPGQGVTGILKNLGGTLGNMLAPMQRNASTFAVMAAQVARGRQSVEDFNIAAATLATTAPARAKAYTKIANAFADGAITADVFAQRIKKLDNGLAGATGVARNFTRVGFVAAIGAMLGGIVALQKDIQKTTGQAVTFGDTFSAVFQVMGQGLLDAVSGFDLIPDSLDTAMQRAGVVVKDAVNYMVGLFDYGYHLIANMSGPAGLGDAVASGFVEVVRDITPQIAAAQNAVTSGLNDIITEVNRSKEAAGQTPWELFTPIDVANVQKNLDSMIKVTDAKLEAQKKKSFGKDYVGNAVAAVTKQAAANKAARDLADAQKNGTGAASKLNKELSDQEKLFESIRQPVLDYTKTLLNANKLLKSGKISLEEYNAALSQTQLITNLLDVDKALPSFKKQAEAKEFAALQNEQVVAVKQAVEARYISEKEGAARIKEIYEQQPKTALDAAQESAQIFKDFASDIVNTTTGLFEDLFSGSINSAKDAADGFYKVFTRMFARLAVAAIAQPVIIPVLSSLGSSLGVPKAGIDSITKELGGGLGGAGSLLGSASLAGSFVGNGLDKVGASLGLNSGFIGPQLPGSSSGVSANFTPGAVLAGLAGNFGANALFGSNRGIGASIGGAVGGIGGTFATGAITTALAASPLAPIAPFIGPALGSFLGNAIGGLFGNKKPSDKTQTGNVDLATGQVISRTGLTGKKFSQENYDAVTQLSSLIGAIGGALGSKGRLDLIVGNRDGVGFAKDGKTQKFGDTGVFLRELTDTLNKSAPILNESLNTALRRIDFSKAKDSMESVLSDINFAIGFDKLGETAEVVSEVKQRFDELNKTFDVAQATAARLGLSEQKVIDARGKMLDTLRRDINTSTQDAIAGDQNGSYTEILNTIKEYQQALKDAAIVGADTALVDTLYKSRISKLTLENSAVQQKALETERERLNVAQELSNRYGRITETFDQIIHDLTYGQFTANDPVTNLNNLRSLVGTTSQQARLGDATAQEKLAELLPEFLKLSEDVNGGNAVFAADRAAALDAAKDVRTVAQRQVELQTRIATAAEKQVQILQENKVPPQDARFFTGKFSGFKADNPNEILVRAVKAGKLQQNQAEALTRSAGFYGAGGEGRASQFFAENASAANSLLQMLRSLGVAGYANGGLITGGVPGRDSVPTLHTPGEYTIKASSVRKMGVATLETMNRTGSLPSNDNEELGRKIDALTRVVAAMGDRLIETGERTASATERVAIGGAERFWA